MLTPKQLLSELSCDAVELLTGRQPSSWTRASDELVARGLWSDDGELTDTGLLAAEHQRLTEYAGSI